MSPIPGTTRDIVEVPLDLDGVPVILSDTAGIRESTDFIEQEGVRRATDLVNRSDVCILLIDPSDPFPFDSDLFDKCHFIVWNKSDVGTALPHSHAPLPHQKQFAISCKTSEGINELFSTLSEHVKSMYVFLLRFCF